MMTLTTILSRLTAWRSDERPAISTGSPEMATSQFWRVTRELEAEGLAKCDLPRGNSDHNGESRVLEWRHPDTEEVLAYIYRYGQPIDRFRINLDRIAELRSGTTPAP